MATSDFPEVFKALRDGMRPYTKGMDVKHDTDDNFYVDTHHIMKNKKPQWFGGVKIGKRYVSYHLMPVYVNPELLKDISPELIKRMQGKSCFNFTKVEPALFKELKALTAAGRKDYESQGIV